MINCKLDDDLTASVLFWKVVEEVHFRQKDLLRIIDRTPYVLVNSLFHQSQWKENSKKRQQLEHDLSEKAKKVLDDILNARLITKDVLDGLQSVSHI